MNISSLRDMFLVLFIVKFETGFVFLSCGSSRNFLEGVGRDRSFACTTDLWTQKYVKAEIFRGASLDFS